MTSSKNMNTVSGEKEVINIIDYRGIFRHNVRL